MKDFSECFARILGTDATPHGWQMALAAETECGNRLLRIPTGFGKTAGVLAAWAWNRIVRADERWPRRLVWCLPMRVLVEQTEAVVRAALDGLGMLRTDDADDDGIGVQVLMGGADAGDWHLRPEGCAVLIGTQDMLLSRALNRGYATPRARWPMEFGLLNHDCLWIMDEVQLMDVGFATSVQLQSFRERDAADGRFLRPCRTWWMSATLQPRWFGCSPDAGIVTAALPETRIPAAQRTGPLWETVSKPLECVEPKADGERLAEWLLQRHRDAGSGAGGPTLVIVNTVERATGLATDLRQRQACDPRLAGTDIRLVHSRFRPAERAHWSREFLNRAACAPGTDRIIVATQVVEAGVDVSAALLVTELAPWASLVQRFGRCARWGGRATVVVADFGPRGAKARPYDEAALEAAREVLRTFTDVAPLHLEAFEETHPDRLPALYPHAPDQLLLRHELDELFDTSPDLSGADIDISRFIRCGPERDLYVFWHDLPERSAPPRTLRPARAALCPVPLPKAREWLFGPAKSRTNPGRMRAWVWDWLDGAWRRAASRDLFPGRTVLVAAACGGYDPDLGWSPDYRLTVPDASVVAPDLAPDEQADAAQDDESLSVSGWRTIATHGREVGSLAREIARTLAPALFDLFDLAGRWHDAGKVHAAFAGSIVATDRPQRCDLAKAPKSAWLPLQRLYPMPDGSRRPGFRHELASTLALFGVLQRHAPDHPALLGPWRALLERLALDPPAAAPAAAGAPTALEREVLALDADAFDLLAYLVCAHHGKLRVAWHAGPADQEATDGRLRIRGVSAGEPLPALPLAAADGSLHVLPATPLDLAPAAAGLSARTGRGWTERVLGLLDRYGPFTLAWLEALLRAADQRASRSITTPDPLLETPHVDSELDTGHRTLAPPAGAGTTPDPAGPHSAQGGAQHGVRGGTGGRGDAAGRTRTPHRATRYLNTALGILSYAELAPHLSRQVQALEIDIVEGRFADRPLDEDLILEFHRRICAGLVPDMAGHWRHVDVRVSDHEAPAFHRLPMLVRDYCRDLDARLAGLAAAPDDWALVLECLAFAEGRLLWIHPFEDFNGRTTRVLLAELLQRLRLPALDPTPEPGADTERYLQALKAADRADWAPLVAIWHARFQKEADA